MLSRRTTKPLDHTTIRKQLALYSIDIAIDPAKSLRREAGRAQASARDEGWRRFSVAFDFLVLRRCFSIVTQKENKRKSAIKTLHLQMQFPACQHLQPFSVSNCLQRVPRIPRDKGKTPYNKTDKGRGNSNKPEDKIETTQNRNSADNTSSLSSLFNTRNHAQKTRHPRLRAGLHLLAVCNQGHGRKKEYDEVRSK